MSDFDRAIDLARDEEYTPPPLAAASPAWEPAPPELPNWTPDAPAPLPRSGPMPALFTSAGVDDAPSPLMTAQEQKQHADEAALVASGGQFTGDNPPAWSQSHMTKEPPPRPAFSNAFADFGAHVADVKQEYEDTYHYPAGMAGMVATGAIAVEDFAQGMANTVHGASDHVESTLEAVRPIREGQHPSAIRALEEGSKAAGGVGQSVLDVTAVGSPLEGISKLGAGGASTGVEPALAHATADGATDLTGKAAADTATKPALDGPLARWTDDEELSAGAGDPLGDLLGEGPEASAVNETGKRGAGMAAKPKHHVYPQEHRDWFEERGFTGDNDIDNSTVELDQADHEAIHGGGDHKLGRQWSGEWNQRAMQAQRDAEKVKGSKLTPDEIKAVTEDLMDEYDIPKDYVPYK